MKTAYLSESSADEAALTILTEAILGRGTETVRPKGLRHRGWAAVLFALPAVLRELHYRSDAEGLALILDSNGSSPHLPAHDSTPDGHCRLCKLRFISNDVLANVRPRPHLPPLKLAFGLAVPAIEAWLLCGVDSHVSEAAWINGQKERPVRLPYSRNSLKQQLYGTSYASLPVMTHAMETAAKRLAQDFSIIEQRFPHGFGALAANLRSW